MDIEAITNTERQLSAQRAFFASQEKAQLMRAVAQIDVDDLKREDRERLAHLRRNG